MSKEKDFKLIPVNDGEFQGHWDLVLPLCQAEHKNHFINPRIHEAFGKHLPHHEFFYFVHVATGPHHASDNWTVVFGVKGHKAHLEKIELGFVNHFH